MDYKGNQKDSPNMAARDYPSMNPIEAAPLNMNMDDMMVPTNASKTEPQFPEMSRRQDSSAAIISEASNQRSGSRITESGQLPHHMNNRQPEQLLPMQQQMQQ